MEILLENQYLSVAIDSLGAELCSIVHKETGRECIWGGDPTVWSRHSPLLFPYVGRVATNKLIIEGKHYPAKQHGFARDLDHKIVCVDGKVATFRLEDSDETREFYPYDFALKTTYKLEKNTVVCKHKVINCDTRPMPFSFGFHTALPCPFVPETVMEDYKLVFEKKEDCTYFDLQDQPQRYAPETNEIELAGKNFNNSLQFMNMSSEYIQLEEKNSGDYIRISGTNSPYTVIWSAPENNQLICIEPWYGRGDNLGNETINLTDRVGIITLKPDEEAVFEQTIEIGFSTKK